MTAPSPPQASGSSGRGALLVSVGILASRLAGLVRQRVLAHYLGTSDAADAVMAAFRVGNITQNLLGEGTLSASFVPIYARLRLDGPEQASKLARAALGALLPALALTSGLGVLLAPTLAGVVASGFEGDKLALTTSLVRVLFPMTGLLVLGAWALGILTAHRRFLLPYAAPVVWSLAQIVALVLAAASEGATPESLAHAVAWGALGGAVLQVGVMAWPIRALLGRLAPSFDLGTAGLREAVSKLPGAVLGRGVLQLSGLVDTALVSFLGAGAIATVNYAQTIYLLPMALLGTGEAAAALPELAERSQGGDEAARRAVQKELGRSLTRVFALGLGATTAFALLSPELVTLLLRGGSFGSASTAEVSVALATYAFGLPANATSRVLSAASFATGDTKRPARYATVRVVVSTLVSLALMRPLGVPGVIVGAVLAAWVELGLLAGLTRRNLGGTGLGDVPLARIAAACFACAAVGLAARLGASRAGLAALPAAVLVLGVAGAAFLGGIDRLGVIRLRGLLKRR